MRRLTLCLLSLVLCAVAAAETPLDSLPTGNAVLSLWGEAGTPAAHLIPQAQSRDWRGAEMVEFQARCAVAGHPKKALKFRLTDGSGRERLYGPFWFGTECRDDWQRFEFMPEAATWKGAADDAFDLADVRSYAFVPDEEMPPLEVRSFRILREPPFAGQWQADMVDADGFLMVDGDRFFPVGIYSCAGATDSDGSLMMRNCGWENTAANRRKIFEEVRASGFNLIQSYTVPQFSGATPAERRQGAKAFLDLADSCGLKALVTVYSMTAFPHLPEALPARRQEFRDFVQSFANHPALAGYYFADEPLPGGAPRRQLEEFYRLLKQDDPRHPAVIVECNDAGFHVYRKAADIMAYDPYPVKDKSGAPTDLAEVSRAIRASKAAAKGGHPVTWAVLQLHCHGDRGPTEAEVRAMVFQALSQDVRGLLFFALSFSWTDDRAPYFLCEPEYWTAVKRVVAEVNRLRGFCTSGKVIDVVCDNDDVISLAKRESGTRSTMVAVYPESAKAGAPAEVAAHFRGIPGETKEIAELDREGTTIRIIPVAADGTFETRFGVNECKVFAW